jgi:hypothetical protein
MKVQSVDSTLACHTAAIINDMVNNPKMQQGALY